MRSAPRRSGATGSTKIFGAICPDSGSPRACTRWDRSRTRPHRDALKRMDDLVDKLLLTTTEAAEALGIGRWKLYDLMRKGLLDSVRIDGCRRIPVGALSDLIAEMASAQGDWPS